MIYKEKDGLHLVTALYSGIVGRSERQATATYLVDTLSREELIQFIERMLLGIEMIKNRERKRPCDKKAIYCAGLPHSMQSDVNE